MWSQYGAKKEEFRRRMIDDLPMPEPLRRLILELEGPRLAVVNSSGRLEIEPVLEAAGIRTRFAVIVTGEDVEHRKPAPDPYLKAAALLGARRPLVVEDSVAGIASGRAAGFDVVEIPHPDETARLVMERLRDPAQVPCSTPVRPRRTG
ncbi:MAG: HAD-IA family hydrolase [Acidobacteria bacterium]|nr:HAD-IA family hydrolase [Acidobacteriota bacterium]